jgi:hypothetical protein
MVAWAWATIVSMMLGPAVPAVQAGSWRVISDPKFPTIVAYDTSRVTKLPHGRVDVWERFTLHPPRHDPDGVVGTIVLGVVVDCAAQQTALRSVARYNSSGTLISPERKFGLGEDSFSDEGPGSLEASALHGLCAALHLPAPAQTGAR